MLPVVVVAACPPTVAPPRDGGITASAQLRP